MDKASTIDKSKAITSWVPIAGKWEFKNDSVRYNGPDEGAYPPLGIALCSKHFRNGTIETTVKLFKNAKKSEGKILIGFRADKHPLSQPYYLPGIGGHGYAYILQQFRPEGLWLPLAAVGKSDDFAPNASFHIKAKISGQKAALLVDNIKVIECNLPTPLNGDQVGLFAVGDYPVEFTIPKIVAVKPKIFVVMQFGKPFDALYKDVIKPLAKKKKLQAFRADDIYKPGVILQDIIKSVTESEIIIADITPKNPNVFYELGYAHAMKKTTILLAKKQAKLPFDLKGFRVIYYDDLPKGKNDVQIKLMKHLTAVLDDF